MVTKKNSTKSEVSRAAKTLSTSKSPKAKTAAAKTLAKKSAAVRKVHSAPKAGSIRQVDVKRAVKSVTKSRSGTPKKGK